MAAQVGGAEPSPADPGGQETDLRACADEPYSSQNKVQRMRVHRGEPLLCTGEPHTGCH